MFCCFNFYPKRFVSLAAFLTRMGRKNRNVNKFAQRKRDRKEQEKNGTSAPKEDTRKGYEDIVKANEAFEKYYKVQKICPDEEWSTFMESLQDSLPTAFRISGSKCEASALLNIVKSEYFAEILNNKSTDDSVKADEAQEEIKPINLPWYPGGLAWQLHLSRTDIRRSEPLYRLHNFLVAETAAGGVSRQEAVSMIPPVVLNVKPHHKVLDMCAAPGSKTAQLIEFLHADEDKTPTGLVIANDVDNSRCYMLVHQAKRLNSPCIVITNHDSAVMPNLLVGDSENPELSKPLKFDRVLCDVPCSGDATLRKNPDIWLKWTTGNGNNLHGIQYRILKRGVEMLSVGGRLVYSTCSFNPVENEAVIHRMLQETGDTMRLVDVADMLPGLKYKKGMTHWRPASKDMVFYNSYKQVPKKWHTMVRPQMFPPAPEETDKYHLDKCIRILPHHQDTGGFFVAVLEKTAPLPWEKTETIQEASKAESKGPENKSEAKTSEDKSEAKSSEDKSEAKAPEDKSEAKAPEDKSEAKAPEDRSEAKAPEDKSEAKAPEDKSEVNASEDKSEAEAPEGKSETKTPEDRSEAKAPEDKSEAKSPENKLEPPRKRRRLGGYKEDPFVFFSGDKEDVFPSIKEFYELSDEFDATCLLTRCHVGKKKNIYMVSPMVKDVVQRNEDKIKIINTGVKTFVRCDNKNMTCAFRLSQEGLTSILPFIGPKRRVDILKEDLILVLQNDNPSKPPELELFSEHTQKLVKDLACGSCVLQCGVPLVGWRGVRSLRAYTAAADTVHHLRLRGADIAKYEINKFKRPEETNKEDQSEMASRASESSAQNDSVSQDSDVKNNDTIEKCNK